MSILCASLGLLASVFSPTIGERIASHAILQARDPVVYDPAYVRLSYPGGDVNPKRGVCTDIVVRALRSIGKDLQLLIHEDAKRRPSRHPRISQLDWNIDHRRCPNQIAFFRAFGKTLTTKTDPASLKQWKPGDFVFWKLSNDLDHVGIVTGTKSGAVPWVVHNLGGTRHEAALNSWRIVGHYQYP